MQTQMKSRHEFTGEFIGTCILVFFGCGSVAVTVLFSAHTGGASHTGLFRVAMVWGLGVALAIYATRHLSCAHLNPAVSIAMVVGERMTAKKLPTYLSAQFAGAFLAEMVGTFALVSPIFALTEGCNVGRPDDSLAPLFVGLTVTSIISVIAPLTQAGVNPARDLSPRLFSMPAGWGTAVLPDRCGGFLTVYVLGRIVGGILAALAFSRVIGPLMGNKADNACKCG